MWLRGWILAKFLLMVTASPAVVPPPWADPVRNPCASRSWQLLHWPADGLCYRIFERGPCPDTMELAFNRGSAGPLCRCSPGAAQWARDGKCYPLYSRGPCSSGSYFAPVPVRNRIRRSAPKVEEEVEEGSGDMEETTKNRTREDSGRSFEVLLTLPVISRGPWGTCRETEQCPFDHVFWPRDGHCYLRLTRGPCPKGDLLTTDPVTGEARCACDEGSELGRYYWPTTRSCYEHFTRGPCEKGALFIPNSKTNRSQCTCHKRLPNYHSPTGLCFPLGTDDPCQPGHWFVYDPIKRGAQCRCKPEHSLWPEDGTCYRLYTRGPCPPAYFLTTNLSQVDTGPAQCTRNPCRRSHLFFPEEESQCHRVATQGPCPLGELVVYEAYRGVSYRGRCGCSPDFSHHYWKATGRCYEHGTKGPCGPDKVFLYDKHKARAECACDRSSGLVEWREKCYHLYTRGPCMWNEWLVPDKDSVKCDCKPGFKYEPVMRTCLPPSVTLVQFLAELAQQRLLSAAG